ncbi:MAG: hypothetical protein Q7S87_08965 [Agitococcus sp.]|nr:hypothetical protein [Agitococcus sp.]MDO9177031.1 hypothetical protein [Agitococcus sp.]
MEKLLRLFAALDWFVGAVCVIMGLYLQNGWYLASGVIAFAAAWLKPAERVNRYLKAKFMRKKEVRNDSAIALAEDDFYDMLKDSAEPSPNSKSELLTYAPRLFTYPHVVISSFTHNKLKAEYLSLKVSTTKLYY